MTDSYTTPDGKTHGYSKSGDMPGAVFTTPVGMNPLGEVVGTYRRSDGVLHGFLLTRTGQERAFLEFHHVRPFADGGPPTVENIQLRCRAHNAYEAELLFGRPVGDQAVDS